MLAGIGVGTGKYSGAVTSLRSWEKLKGGGLNWLDGAERGHQQGRDWGHVLEGKEAGKGGEAQKSKELQERE
jgi:hypothetical protein